MSASPKDQFEYIVEKFQDIVNQFDKLKEKIPENEKSLNEHANKLQNLKEKYDKNSELLEKFTKICTENATISHERLENAFSAIAILTVEKDKHKKEIQGNKNSILSINKIIREILEELQLCVGNIELDEIKKSFEEAKKIIDKNFYSLEIKHKELKLQNDDTRKILDDYKSFNGGVAKSLSDLESVIHVCNKNHENLKKQMSIALDSKEFLLKKYVNDQISAIPQPKIPSLDEAKKSMKEEIEPISFDAKNAHLRSENNERKIQILEKKVEQLQLLLNKFQLGN